MTTARAFNLEIRPVDTLMFRNGRPFNQGDPGAAEAVSVFPPYPSTVSGMVRALIGARRDLSVSAPVVCDSGKPLFPAPRSILKRENGSYAQLIPAPTQMETDLGDTFLPQPVIAQGESAGGLKEIEDSWIALDGLRKVLSGGVPEAENFIPRDKLWRPEPRVGIGIDNMSDGAGNLVSNLKERRPIDGALYAATHTRLAESVTLHVTVSALAGGDITLDLPLLGPVGGEHRMAEFAADDDPPKLPEAPALAPDGDVVCFTIYHASPCFLHPRPKANAPFGKVPTTRDGDTACLAEAKIVSACVGKALMIGGWSLGARGPVPMRPAIPAGSVWFLEAPKDHATALTNLHGKRIGESLGRGFGQIFIGKW